MTRSYTAHDFIQLPPLDANETTVVARQIATVATTLGHLPGSVSDVLVELGASADALVGELKRAAPATDPAAQREADHAVDIGWASFEQWLAAFAKLPLGAGPEVAIAQSLHARLFPDGTRFLNLRFRSEWAESDRRLAILQEEKLDAEVAKLGGAPFLVELRRAHGAYGAALHVTDPLPDPGEPKTVRVRREATQNVMRTLVAEVATASQRKQAPLSKEAAQKLLAPITAWRPSPRAATVAPADAAKESAPV
jgi:hypothetical protein